jgi:bifunctional DNase/RNase/DNA-binding transcriptional MerR regulator
MQPSRRAQLESIGKFSKRSGIPVSRLRHYHQVGLLLPAYVDPESGYRYYAAAQHESADVIAILRSIDMPVRDIQSLLDDPSERNVRELLAAHRLRLEDRLANVAGRLEAIDRLAKEGTLMKRQNRVARDGFVSVHVEEVTSEVPSGERWSELREILPLLPAEPQEVDTVKLTSDDGRSLSLWIGRFEGNALRLAMGGIQTERPLTYDLMLEAFDRHGVRVVRADITRVVDGTFMAELITQSKHDESQTFDCRPSDALNLALRSGVQVAVSREVIEGLL